MKISQMIEQLSEIQEKHGDIEVTCTATALRDMTYRGEKVDHAGLADVWESTAERLIVSYNNTFGVHVRVWL